jgi:hypothetical protein
MTLSAHHLTFKTATGCAALLLFLIQGASAQVVTESFSYTSTTQAMPYSDLFSLPDFNTSLGTLQEIEIILSVNSTSDIGVFNTSDDPVSFNDASVTLPTSLTGPGPILVNATLDASVISGIANPGFNSYSGLTDSATETKKVSSRDFNSWENQVGGKIKLTYATGNGSYTGGGPLHTLYFGGSAKGSETTTLKYTYLATPEPPRVVLFGMVMGALVLLLARRGAVRDL